MREESSYNEQERSTTPSFTINLKGNEDYSFLKKYGVTRDDIKNKKSITIKGDKEQFRKDYTTHSKNTNKKLVERNQKAKQIYFDKNKSQIKAEAHMQGRGQLSDEELKNQMSDIYSQSKQEESNRKVENAKRNNQLNNYISNYENLTPQEKQAYQWIQSHQHDYNTWKKDKPNSNLNDYVNYLNKEHKGWQDTEKFAHNVGMGIVGGAGVLSGGLGTIGKRLASNYIYQKGTKSALDNTTNLSENTKNLISNGVGFGVGFGSGNLLNRAGKGVIDYALYDRVYNPTAQAIAGDHWYTPIIAGGVQGVSQGITNSLGRNATAFIDKSLVQNNTFGNRTSEFIRDNITMPSVNKFNIGNQVTTGGHGVTLNGMSSLLTTGIGAAGEGVVSSLPYSGISVLSNSEPGRKLRETVGDEIYDNILTGTQILTSKRMNNALHGKSGAFVHRSSGGAKDAQRAVDNIKADYKKIKLFNPSTWHLGNYNGSVVAKWTPARRFQGQRAHDSSGKTDGWLRVQMGDGEVGNSHLKKQVEIVEGFPELQSRKGSTYDNAYNLYHQIYPQGLITRRGVGQRIAFVSPQTEGLFNHSVRKLANEDFTFDTNKSGEVRGDHALGPVEGNKVEYYNGDGHMVLNQNGQRYYWDVGGTGSAGLTHNHKDANSTSISESPTLGTKLKEAAVTGVKTWLDRSQSGRIPVLVDPIKSNPHFNPTNNNTMSLGFYSRQPLKLKNN